MIIDGFERPSRRVSFVEFLVVLILYDIAGFIVSNDLVELPIRHFDQEFNLLVIDSIIIANLSCNQGSKLTTVRHVANEGKAKEFIRTEMRQF